MDTAPPIIILDHPQMGENIGAAARAMLNCNLTALRLVAPRDGWPNERAETMSSGALEKIPPVQIFETLQEAVADCHYVYATTARLRDMVKPVFTPNGAAQDCMARAGKGQSTAFVFGGERAGLANDDVSRCDAIINIPLNPAFSSLNLGQAVLLICYAYQSTIDQTKAKSLPTGDSHPANHEAFANLMQRLEDKLEDKGFFKSDDMKPSITRNLRNTLSRAEMTEQEIQTFHGIISVLSGSKDSA